jgi:hypothetical protein
MFHYQIYGQYMLRNFNTPLLLQFWYDFNYIAHIWNDAKMYNILPFTYDNVYITLYCYILKTFSPLRMAAVHSRNM